MKVELSEFKDLAYRAFYWTSFNPDDKGNRTISEFENELNSDLSKMPESEHERYTANYKKYFSAWLTAHSNCASSAVTGGSNFNVRRAEKANYSEQRRYQEFIEWRERALKAIEKKVEESKPKEQKQNEAWLLLEKDILRSAAIIHGINIGVERGISKPLIVSNLYGKVETHAKNGNVEIVQKAIDCIRNFNETMSVVITERHKFFKLIEVAENNRDTIEENQERESQKLEIEGGSVVFNYQENRLQIIFNEKPDPEIIHQLKKNAFRWSPRFGAWQRFNNNNSIFALKQIIKYLKEK